MKKTGKIVFAVVTVVYFVFVFVCAAQPRKYGLAPFIAIGTALYLAYIVYFLYRYFAARKKARQTRLDLRGATMSGTLKHVSGLPLAKGLTVEMFYGPDKIVFKKDGQEISVARDKVTGIDFVTGDGSGRKALAGAASGKYVAGGAGAAVGALAAIDTYLIISYTSEGKNKSVKLDAAGSGLFPSKVAKDFQKTYRPKREKIDL